MRDFSRAADWTNYPEETPRLACSRRINEAQPGEEEVFLEDASRFSPVSWGRDTRSPSSRLGVGYCEFPPSSLPMVGDFEEIEEQAGSRVCQEESLGIWGFVFPHHIASFNHYSVHTFYCHLFLKVITKGHFLTLHLTTGLDSSCSKERYRGVICKQ